MGELLSYPKFVGRDATGIALAGGWLYTYESGTTTPKAAYQDEALTTPHTNPIELDANGEAEVWLDGEYTIVLEDVDLVQQWTMDDVVGWSYIDAAITASAAEINILSGATISTAELNALDGLTATAAELNYNDITTLGQSENSKTVTQDAGGAIVIGAADADQTIDVASHDEVDGGLKLAGTLVTASAAEINILDGLTVTTAQINSLSGGSVNAGVANRAEFEYRNADDIYIGAGSYHHQGTVDQMVYWNTQLIFGLGSGGSNINSLDLLANEWNYIYLDNSAIVTNDDPLLVASCFLNTTIAPSWDPIRKGWYYTVDDGGPAEQADRCIFAILTDGSANILEFFHADDIVLFADYILDFSSSSIGATWTDAVISAPTFATKVQLTFTGFRTDDGADLWWRVNGQSGSLGHLIFQVTSGSTYGANTLPVITDLNQTIEVKYVQNVTNEAKIWTDGWYMPRGM